ncbi:MAG: glycosyltransferase family A protein [Caldilineaceae bacterium]
MAAPKVSIIMPTYNQARYIGAAIQSVVDQTFPDWELIIVDDGSTDETAAIVTQFNEPRIHYIDQVNQGVCIARNVGIAKARGEYLAFLDADDLYERNKLQVQVAHLDQNPTIGLTYGWRTEIDQHGNPLNLARLPATASLETIVLSFPFAPSDFMVRRTWVDAVGGFRLGFVVNEDRDLYIRLVLAGCQCVNSEQFLSYRRLNTEKTFSDLPAKLDDMLRALDTAFSDPRCPDEVQVLYNAAHRTIYLDWAYQAAIQGESALAQAYFRKVLDYDPAMLANEGKQLLHSLIYTATSDGGDPELRLHRIFAQLPPEMSTLATRCNWAIAHGYLLRGLSNVLWGRQARGCADFTCAARLGVTLDKVFLHEATVQLLNYEARFGAAVAQNTFQKLIRALRQSRLSTGARWLYGCYSINVAFRYYRNRQYTDVPLTVVRALLRDPLYLLNRGVVAILVRSTIHLLRPSTIRTWCGLKTYP